MFFTAAAPVAAQMGAVAVRAKGTQELIGEIWTARDEVVITYQDVRIQCDEVELNQSTGDVYAIGSVIVDKGPQRFTADEMRYNLQTKTGTFTNATGNAPPTYSFTGKLLERIDDTHFRIVDGTFTACEMEDRPPWDLHLREALVEEGGYAHIKGAAFRVKRVPLLYFPYLLWPVKTDRAAGILPPSLGFSDRRGFYVGASGFIPLGRSYDTTIRLDYFSYGYYGVGTEFRWAPVQGAFGEILGYAIRDPNDGVWQWKIDGRHRQNNFFGFKMLAEVHELSDNDFFREFENDYNANTRRSLYSQIYLTRSRGPATINFRVDRRVTFLDSNDVILHQLPEAEYRVRSNRIGESAVYWNLITSANVFNVDRGGDLKGIYSRADLFPEISYTLPGSPWLTVTPTLGARATWYSSRYSEDRQTFEEEPISRTYVKGGVDIVGPSFSRIFDTHNLKGTRFKHLIEPRLEYRYLSEPEEEASLIPVFDEVDSTPDVNRMRLTLSNKLYVKSNNSLGAREVMTFDIFQEYSFRDPLSHGSGGVTSPKGPIGVALRIVPTRGTAIDARASYDALTRNLRSRSLSASTYLPSFNAGMTWYESYSPTTGERNSSQAQVRFGLTNKEFPLTFNFHIAYDMEKEALQQQRYGIGYKGSCWGIRAEYQDLKSAAFPARNYRLIISLKGIGELPAIKGSLSGGGG